MIVLFLCLFFDGPGPSFLELSNVNGWTTVSNFPLLLEKEDMKDKGEWVCKDVIQELKALKVLEDIGFCMINIMCKDFVTNGEYKEIYLSQSINGIEVDRKDAYLYIAFNKERIVLEVQALNPKKVPTKKMEVLLEEAHKRFINRVQEEQGKTDLLGGYPKKVWYVDKNSSLSLGWLFLVDEEDVGLIVDAYSGEIER